MKSRCRTDLLASIFPGCILMYFLPVFLNSADIFVGLSLKNMFQRTRCGYNDYTCKDTPVMIQTLNTSHIHNPAP